jgi:hypothetical protein
VRTGGRGDYALPRKNIAKLSPNMFSAVGKEPNRHEKDTRKQQLFGGLVV